MLRELSLLSESVVFGQCLDTGEVSSSLLIITEDIVIVRHMYRKKIKIIVVSFLMQDLKTAIIDTIAISVHIGCIVLRFAMKDSEKPFVCHFERSSY